MNHVTHDITPESFPQVPALEERHRPGDAPPVRHRGPVLRAVLHLRHAGHARAQSPSLHTTGAAAAKPVATGRPLPQATQAQRLVPKAVDRCQRPNNASGAGRPSPLLRGDCEEG